MGTLKKLIGVGVVTGVVVYTYLKLLSRKVNSELPEATNENAQLV